MRNLIVTAAEAAALIASGTVMLVSGPERALAALPYGRWIGTTAEQPAENESGIEAERLCCTLIEPNREIRIALVPPGARPVRPAGAVCHLMTPGQPLRRLTDGAPEAVAPTPVEGGSARVFDGRSGMAFDALSLALTVCAPAETLAAAPARPAQRRLRLVPSPSRRVAAFHGTGPARPAHGRSPVAVMKPED
ncbi:DUF6976 family protein [Roseomonas elaeocarpi]|uniref:DUF6976 family protein n=1 Tax=Roseomonas elaeocarpi TaxID=907779 RepID=A0ABV6JTZ6_9PROT